MVARAQQGHTPMLEILRETEQLNKNTGFKSRFADSGSGIRQGPGDVNAHELDLRNHEFAAHTMCMLACSRFDHYLTGRQAF
jgi:hypothetical protein